jgi:DNA-binding GntR family transcriptional regulator
MPRPNPARVRDPRLPITVDRLLPAPEQVYRALRHAILRLDLKPGEPLSEPEIAARAGVSRTPVREAMKRLAAERLVVIYPNVGAAVARMSLQALSEALLLRELVECEVAARIAAAPDRAVLEELERAVRAHEHALSHGDTDLAYVSDERFHRTLFAAQGFTLMWDCVDQARSQLERLHHLMVAARTTLDQAVSDHRRILERVAASDPAGARVAMADHLGINHRFLAALASDGHPYLAAP